MTTYLRRENSRRDRIAKETDASSESSLLNFHLSYGYNSYAYRVVHFSDPTCYRTVTLS